ncbi:Legumain [Fasciola hepatica]|uniref:Legumain n=1 Tax=Fasciola hepatica TaxID=6192 RepID=A0A4E0QX38_FASHE|nr:Legumain [Fasciola hepatica]
MQFCSLILSLLISFTLGLEDNGRTHWAVLVAGSNGWSNYRHQADVCHAYHVLRENGIPPENIITMIYDDIAKNTENPFPGKLFNDYQHKDVYAGVKIDYRDELYAKQLNKTLANMYREKRFKKMVIYIEACHSGSMFRWILPKNIDVWAVTAANPTESSWATFCEDPVIKTCLSDEFSYQWMNDTEKHRGHLFNRSMLDQYLDVQSAVKKSHVMEYGDLKISFLPVGEFQANSTHVGSSGFNGDSSMATRDGSMASHAHLIPLMHQLKRSNSPKQMELAQRRLHRALKLGQMVKETVDEIVEEVTSKSAPPGKPSDVHEHLDCYQNVCDQYGNKCFSIQQVPEVAKELAKLDRLCEQGYDTNVILQTICNTCD